MIQVRRRWLLGTARDIMRPGAGVRDPGRVSPSAYLFLVGKFWTKSLSGARPLPVGNVPLKRPSSGLPARSVIPAEGTTIRKTACGLGLIGLNETTTVKTPVGVAGGVTVTPVMVIRNLALLRPVRI